MEDHRRWRSEADRLRIEAIAEERRMTEYWRGVLEKDTHGDMFLSLHPDIQQGIDSLNQASTLCCWPGCIETKAENLQVCQVHALEAGAAYSKKLGRVLADKRRYERKLDRERQQREFELEQMNLAELYHEPHRKERKRRVSEATKRSMQRALDTGEKVDPTGEYEWVYFVRTDGLVKIGYTSDPGSRLKAYPPSAEVLVVMPGNRWLETQLHRKFATYLARGREWFTESDKLHEYIEQQIENYGQPKPEWSTERFARGRFESEEILEDGTRKIQLRTKRPAA